MKKFLIITMLLGAVALAAPPVVQVSKRSNIQASTVPTSATDGVPGAIGQLTLRALDVSVVTPWDGGAGGANGQQITGFMLRAYVTNSYTSIADGGGYLWVNAPQFDMKYASDGGLQLTNSNGVSLVYPAAGLVEQDIILPPDRRIQYLVNNGTVDDGGLFNVEIYTKGIYTP